MPLAFKRPYITPYACDSPFLKQYKNSEKIFAK
jgi:hypothetical protein